MSIDFDSTIKELEKRDKAAKAEQRREDAAEWKRYSLYLLGFLFFLLIGMIVMDKLIMPAYVGLGDVVRVPNVQSIPLDSAKLLLRKNGLEPRQETSHFHRDIPEGHIVSQLPYPRSEVKNGRRVYLIASKGRQYVRMPVLRGKSLRDARISLMRNGLKLDGISYVHNEDVTANQVVYQSAEPETKLDFNTTIDVVVSLGPKISYRTVPNLVGKTLADAEQILVHTGLSLGFVNYTQNETFFPNTVVEQFPFPGDQVEEGSAINVSVNLLR